MRLNLILYLFFIIPFSIYSQELGTYELNSNLENVYEVENNRYVIETDGSSFLYYNSENDSYKEYYCNYFNFEIYDIIEYRGYIFFAGQKSVRIVSLNNNAYLFNENTNDIIYFYKEGNKLLGLNKSNNIYEISLPAGSETLDYKQLYSIPDLNKPIKEFDKFYYSTKNGNIYEYNNNTTVKIAEISDFETPNEIYFENDVFVFKYKSIFKIYSKPFQLIAEVDSDSTKNHLFFSDRYFRNDGKNKTFEYNYEGNILSSSTTQLIDNLDYFKVNDIRYLNSKLYSFGENKLITKTLTSDSVIYESIFQYPQSLNRGHFDLLSNSVIGYASDKNFFFYTSDAGATWSPYKGDNEYYKYERTFNHVKTINDSVMICFGEGALKSTLLLTNINNEIELELLRRPSINNNYTPYFGKFEGRYYLIFHSVNSTGNGLKIVYYDNKFDIIYNDYFPDYHHYSTAQLGNKFVSILYKYNNDSNVSWYLMEGDLANDNIIISDKNKDRILYGITVKDNKFYLLEFLKDTDEMNLLVREQGEKQWETVKTFDKFFTNIFSYENRIYAKDSNNVFYEIDDSYDLIKILDESNDKLFRNVVIRNNSIYLSSKNKFTRTFPILKLDELTDVEETETIPDFDLINLFPNPADTEINIQIDHKISEDVNNTQVDIIGINGSSIKKGIEYKINNLSNYKAELSADISDISPGYYFMVISLSDTKEIIPFIKK